MSSPIITCTVTNPALPQPPGLPALVYAGQAATLAVALGNATGGDIGLAATAGSASTVEVFLPSFFPAGALEAMRVSLAGWTAAYQAADQSILLTFVSGAATWSTGQTLTITIDNAVAADSSAGSPAPTQALQCNFAGMTGNVPLQTEAPLSVARVPQPGAASLAASLWAGLEDPAAISVSAPYDPLTNTISLTFKNIGATALFTGTKPWATQPRITVSFVYGRTPGALAPDDDRAHPELGSAWSITARIASSEGNAWTVSNAVPTGSRSYPLWTFTPDATDPGILGPGSPDPGGSGGDQANVTIAFENVVSLTASGHTQMIVQCTGFPKDDATAYDDHTFVLDIDKRDGRPGRGVSNVQGTSAMAVFTDPAVPIDIPLRWSMADVASVTIECDRPGVAPQVIEYWADPSRPLSPAATGDTTFRVGNGDVFTGGAVQGLTDIIFTISAYPGAPPGTKPVSLSSQQFIVGVSVAFLHDPRDGKTYPVILDNGLYWMTKNLDYDAGATSMFLNNDPANEAAYGRLYNHAGAMAAPPLWRLPTLDEWLRLIGSATTHPDPNASPPVAVGSAARLLPSGTSGFNLQFGSSLFPNYFYFGGLMAVYWVDDPTFVFVQVDQQGNATVYPYPSPFGGGGGVMGMSADAGSAGASTGDSYWTAVRYVMGAPHLAAYTASLRA